MWNIEYKPSKNSEAWLILESHDNKTSACFIASRVSDNYFRIKVTEPDGSIIWSKWQNRAA